MLRDATRCSLYAIRATAMPAHALFFFRCLCLWAGALFMLLDVWCWRAISRCAPKSLYAERQEWRAIAHALFFAPCSPVLFICYRFAIILRWALRLPCYYATLIIITLPCCCLCRFHAVLLYDIIPCRYSFDATRCACYYRRYLLLLLRLICAMFVAIERYADAWLYLLAIDCCFSAIRATLSYDARWCRLTLLLCHAAARRADMPPRYRRCLDFSLLTPLPAFVPCYYYEAIFDAPPWFIARRYYYYAHAFICRYHCYLTPMALFRSRSPLFLPLLYLFRLCRQDFSPPHSAIFIDMPFYLLVDAHTPALRAPTPDKTLMPLTPLTRVYTPVSLFFWYRLFWYAVVLLPLWRDCDEPLFAYLLLLFVCWRLLFLRYFCAAWDARRRCCFSCFDAGTQPRYLYFICYARWRACFAIVACSAQPATLILWFFCSPYANYFHLFCLFCLSPTRPVCTPRLLICRCRCRLMFYARGLFMRLCSSQRTALRCLFWALYAMFCCLMPAYSRHAVSTYYLPLFFCAMPAISIFRLLTDCHICFTLIFHADDDAVMLLHAIIILLLFWYVARLLFHFDDAAMFTRKIFYVAAIVYPWARAIFSHAFTIYLNIYSYITSLCFIKSLRFAIAAIRVARGYTADAHIDAAVFTPWCTDYIFCHHAISRVDMLSAHGAILLTSRT